MDMMSKLGDVDLMDALGTPQLDAYLPSSNVTINDLNYKIAVGIWGGERVGCQKCTRNF